MLMGESQHSLDVKGRVTIPAKFREELGTCFVAAKGLENCIYLYPQHEWEIVVGRMREMSAGQQEARAFQRFFFSGAAEMEMDKQGRVILPPNLREYADIDKQVYITGVVNRLEIWDADKWETYNTAAAQSFVDNAANLIDFGF